METVHETIFIGKSSIGDKKLMVDYGEKIREKNTGLHRPNDKQLEKDLGDLNKMDTYFSKLANKRKQY